jgi:murein DD-endopeptidase MepM/ murein hydrolase activator NlpD
MSGPLTVDALVAQGAEATGNTVNRATAPAPAPSRQTEQPQTVAPAKPKYALEEYTIAAGDTIWDIANRFNTDVNSIVALNPAIRDTALQPGTKLQVPNFKGAVHTVASGDTLSGIAAMYGLDVSQIAAANDLSGDTIAIGQRLVLPGAKIPEKTLVASRSDSARASAGSSGAFAWPLHGPITSYFGPRWGTIHTGIDIGVDVGTPVRAAAGGTVIEVGWDGGYGKNIIIEHPNGMRTRYAHLSAYEVAVGDTVEQGQVIARSGNTGNSTGPHLHFEIIVDGRTQNPMNYLP